MSAACCFEKEIFAENSHSVLACPMKEGFHSQPSVCIEHLENTDNAILHSPKNNVIHTEKQSSLLCAIACIVNICVHVKYPVVHIRIRWTIETLKHPACTVGRVARLCRSWFSPKKATRISHGKIPNGTIQLCRKIGREVDDTSLS